MYSKHNQKQVKAIRDKVEGRNFLSLVYPHHGIVINMVLIRIAATAPSAVEFHNHQVVPIFHTNIVKKTYLNKTRDGILLLANNNNGTHATVINKVNDALGHAAINNSADNKLSATACIGFND